MGASGCCRGNHLARRFVAESLGIVMNINREYQSLKLIISLHLQEHLF